MRHLVYNSGQGGRGEGSEIKRNWELKEINGKKQKKNKRKRKKKEIKERRKQKVKNRWGGG